MKPYTHVIWDWNGTLFDDTDWCIKVINTMLKKRLLKPLDSLEAYHGIFGFPVVDYYRRAGFDFDKEPFEELSLEFISLYHSADRENCRLREGAESVLKELSKLNITQAVLSASEITNLIRQTGYYNIAGYFDEILGISDIYARSKIDTGLDYISRKGVRNAVLIGDTVHDYETARALGADCVLLSGGHQARDKLLECGVAVLDDIGGVLERVCG